MSITRKLASGSVAVLDPANGKVVTILPEGDEDYGYEAGMAKPDLSPEAPAWTSTWEDGHIHRYDECKRVPGKPNNCQCDGTGNFYSGGGMLNGKYTGKVGVCYRCGGKGWQNNADQKRNEYYDNNVRRFVI